MKNKKPKVGDILYSLNVGNSARGVEQKLTPVTVTKVGRKYFSCKGSYWETQYHLLDWKEKSDYSANSMLFKSPQEWEDEKETRRICQKISKAFEYNRSPITSLQDLRKIESILDKYK